MSAEAPRAAAPTEFTDAEHQLLDAMNVPANRIGRGLLFREMQRTGLDPFAKHIYLREDWNKNANKNVYTVASTIDGFRIVAARQSSYEGQTAPQWCDKNGNWTESWWVDAPPVAARIGVYVRGYREPMWGIARFNEYKPGGNGGFMWSKMPALMIAKVAEALAIRKAYPDQLSGVYTDDEMQQADARKDEQANSNERKTQRRDSHANDEWNTATGQPLPPPAPGVPNATAEQIGELVKLLGIKRRVFNGQCARVVSELVRRRVDDPRTLSQAEARSVIETLAAEPDAAEPSPAPGPAPVGSPDNPAITAAQQRAMHALLNKAGYGDRARGLELLARYAGHPIESSKELSKAEATAIIDKLSNGELPPPAAPEPSGPDANGEGISEFDALDQMILDVDSDEAAAAVEKAVADELMRGGITRSDAELLLERLGEHVSNAKATAA